MTLKNQFLLNTNIVRFPNKCEPAFFSKSKPFNATKIPEQMTLKGIVHPNITILSSFMTEFINLYLLMSFQTCMILLLLSFFVHTIEVNGHHYLVINIIHVLCLAVKYSIIEF